MSTNLFEKDLRVSFEIDQTKIIRVLGKIKVDSPILRQVSFEMNQNEFK